MDKKVLLGELHFKAVRSSGPGGQNVNKVASKVQLVFDVGASKGLSDRDKERLFQKFQGKLTKGQQLVLHCDVARSQFKNKELVTKRFFELIKSALFVPKKRKTDQTLQKGD